MADVLDSPQTGSTAPQETGEERLLTAEEFLTLNDGGRRSELVKGRVIELSEPGFEHGAISAWLAYLMQGYLLNQNIGRPVVEVGVVTQRGPDTVRGPDAAFYSYERLPADQRPRGYADVSPEVVFEVLSPSNRQGEILRKIAEYFAADVLCVVVVNPARRTAVLYHPDDEPTFLREQDRLALPAPLDGWTPTVAELLSEGN
ncbi:Uma2 family endonuclease [Alienimonas californiensis]|uniref:Putative restriction endonuclease domain-containing protein n=1 Tax=Alienimonas californiensis TaxID=2527989 RepID=A0A517PBS0_9PLAN|nr:Uma2 family endonuclease [Alienimonas californiensis]QDT16833.1 hypothetical protein CA12_29400 [Alienimonas californiensis]